MRTKSDRDRQRALLWRDPDPVRAAHGGDGAVRRLLDLAFRDARLGLTHGDVDDRAERGERLELAGVPTRIGPDEHRIPGVVHLGGVGGAVSVDLVLAPWSAARSELRLELRRTRRTPARYYDAADRALDRLDVAIRAVARARTAA
jgi:hypothetical protein